MQIKLKHNIGNVVEDSLFSYVSFTEMKQSVKQGWKIHISAFYDNYNEVLNTVSQVCGQEGLNFKFINNTEALTYILSKQCQRGEGGKFITIYPVDEETTHRVLNKLAENLKNQHGPYVVSDYWFNQNIYYRYGAIHNPTIINGVVYISDSQGNLYLDNYPHFIGSPSFIENPFIKPEMKPEENDELILKGRYEFKDLIHPSFCGNIYHFIDRHTNQDVVLKEARQWTGYSEKLTSEFYRKKEAKVLQALSKKHVVPKVIDQFEDEGNFYLVVEHIDGLTLREYFENFNISAQPYHLEYPQQEKQILAIIEKVVDIIYDIHQSGYVLNDISADNFMITQDGRLLVVDCEDFEQINQPVDYSIINYGIDPRSYPHLNHQQIDCFKLGHMFIDILTGSTRYLETEPTGDLMIRHFMYLCDLYAISSRVKNLVLSLISIGSRTLNRDVMLTMDPHKNYNPKNYLFSIEHRLALIRDTFEKEDINYHELSLFNQLMTYRTLHKKHLQTHFDYFNFKGDVSSFTLRNELSIILFGEFEDNRSQAIELQINDYLNATPVTMNQNLGLLDGRCGQLLFLLKSNHDYQHILEKEIKEICDIVESDNYYLAIDEMNYSPYLADGTAGLLLVMSLFIERFKRNPWPYHYLSIQEALLFRTAKNASFGYGSTGIGYSLLKAYHQHQNQTLFNNILEIVNGLMVFSYYHDDLYTVAGADPSKHSLDFLTGLAGVKFFYDNLRDELNS